MLKVQAMPPRRRPTARLLTPVGLAGLLAVAGLAVAIGLAVMMVLQPR
jgi:hypothetical protein